jgi:hypothetical protein
MTSPVLVLFPLIKMLPSSLTMFCVPSFFLALQSPAPLEPVSSSHRAPFSKARCLARRVHHHAFTWKLSTRSESIYAHSYARWSTVFRLFLSVSPGHKATSRRVGSLSSLRAESVVTRNPVPLPPHLWRLLHAPRKGMQSPPSRAHCQAHV